jgi:hypothetical protein
MLTSTRLLQQACMPTHCPHAHTIPHIVHAYQRCPAVGSEVRRRAARSASIISSSDATSCRAVGRSPALCCQQRCISCRQPGAGSGGLSGSCQSVLPGTGRLRPPGALSWCSSACRCTPSKGSCMVHSCHMHTPKLQMSACRSRAGVGIIGVLPKSSEHCAMQRLRVANGKLGFAQTVQHLAALFP